jgi:hypothetical protein
VDKHTMAWAEFAPGQGPGDTSQPDGEVGFDLDPEINGGVLKSPLPGITEVHQVGGLFNSDGVLARHMFLQKADVLFDASGCAEACG